MSIDKNMFILVVDDYKLMLKMTRDLLNQLGFYNIDEAMDGGAAMKMIEEKPYKLVISDWNMEPVGGLELLKRIRSHEKLANLPFIMITSETKAENVLAAKEHGVNNYIVKPFNIATLKAKLQAVIGNF